MVMKEIAGRGWVRADPPNRADDESVVARVNGEPVKAAFRTDVLEDNGDVFHARYRSGGFDLEVKVETVGNGMGYGQIKVEEADGYDD